MQHAENESLGEGRALSLNFNLSTNQNIGKSSSDTPSFSYGKDDDVEANVNTEHPIPPTRPGLLHANKSPLAEQEEDVSRIPALTLLDQVRANEGSASEIISSKASSSTEDERQSELSCDTCVDEGDTIKVVGELPDTPRQQMEEDFIDHTFFTMKGPITIL